jgi:hypothetical protein
MLKQEAKKPVAQVTSKKSLKSFIDENDKMFTAIGVMGALAALFTTLKNGEYLAFLSFVLLYILDFQLLWSMPKIKDSSISLVLFEGFSQVLLGAIAVYVIQLYPKYFVLVIPTITGFMSAALYVFLRQKHSRKTAAIAAGIVFAVLMVVYYIATYFHHVSFQ